MSDLVEVCVGKRFRVSMTLQVAKRFRKVDSRQQARCQKWMKFYSDDGHDFLNKEQLRFEGHFSAGDPAATKVGVWAFKAWQLRLYGGVVAGNHFIATEIDASKKTDAADRTKLEAAAQKLLEFM